MSNHNNISNISYGGSSVDDDGENDHDDTDDYENYDNVRGVGGTLMNDRPPTPTQTTTAVTEVESKYPSIQIAYMVHRYTTLGYKGYKDEDGDWVFDTHKSTE